VNSKEFHDERAFTSVLFINSERLGRLAAGLSFGLATARCAVGRQGAERRPWRNFGLAILGAGSIGRETSALQKKIVLSLSFRQRATLAQERQKAIMPRRMVPTSRGGLGLRPGTALWGRANPAYQVPSALSPRRHAQIRSRSGGRYQMAAWAETTDSQSHWGVATIMWREAL
jgi:hypothetical protein